jgi:hypothetical protein
MSLVSDGDRHALIATVERLHAEVETLRAQRDGLEHAHSEAMQACGSLRAKLDKVRAAIAPQCLECLTGEHTALTAHEVYGR